MPMSSVYFTCNIFYEVRLQNLINNLARYIVISVIIYLYHELLFCTRFLSKEINTSKLIISRFEIIMNIKVIMLPVGFFSKYL